ncbi:hypothetical protein Tco_1409699 [Tanacetum coccineum]
MRIPEDEWRGKDTSLTHLKVFGCDSFIKVKDVYGEAMKCKFIGKGSNEMQNNFQDMKSHQVIRSRDITFVDSIYGAKSMTDSKNVASLQSIGFGSKSLRALASSKEEARDSTGTKIPPESPGALSKVLSLSTKLFVLTKNGEPVLFRSLEISSGKNASQSLSMFMVKEEQDGSKSCEDDYNQVGDEREVEFLRSFNWHPSKLIMDDGVLPEEGYSQFNDVSSGYLGYTMKMQMSRIKVIKGCQVMMTGIRKKNYVYTLEAKVITFGVQKHRGSKQVGLKQLGHKQVGFKQLGHKQVEFKQLGPCVKTGVHGV